MKIFIEYLAPSTNAAYAGQHWGKRTKHKALTVMAVRVALGANTKKFDQPVRVEVLPHLGKGKRAYDVSNYSYAYKLIEDALVEKKVLVNDTANFVKEVCFKKPVRSEKSGIQILIEVA
jgi:hypothetical protein